jgi:hypothetical protein
MNKDIIDPPYVFLAFSLFEESNLSHDKRRVGSEQFLPDPLEDQTSFLKAMRTCSNEGAGTSFW